MSFGLAFGEPREVKPIKGSFTPPKQTLLAKKTYLIHWRFDLSTFLVDIQNDGPIYWANAKTPFFKTPCIYIRKGSPKGPLAAVIKLNTRGDFSFYPGDPKEGAVPEVQVEECGRPSDLTYQFHINGQAYAWQSAKENEISTIHYSEGEVPSTERDWKLVTASADLNHGDPLTVLGMSLQNEGWTSIGRGARIHLFESLSEETELWALAVIIGLQERARRGQGLMDVCGFN